MLSRTHGVALIAEASPMIEPRLRALRIRQIIQAIWLAMAASAVASIAKNQLADTVVLGIAACLLLGAWRLVGRGRAELGTGLMLGTMTGMITLLAWSNAGARDPAVLAYPGILIFASMLGSRRLLFSLLGIMLAVVAALVVSSIQGWHVHVTRPMHIGDFFDVAGILSVTGFAVWLMANDLHQALKGLQAENERVRESQARIEFIASHDALTTLPNRILARHRFEQTMAD